MRLVFVVLLTFGLCATLTVAQDRVAEGEYQMLRVTASGAPVTKTATRWVLYEKSPGHFRLESEIENQPAGTRVVQIEELTDHLVPTAIGYELYRKDQQIPSIIATCDFSTGAVVCTGNSGKDRAVPSTPYTPKGPFWMWMEGLFSLDMPWLFDGAVNMAHLEKGTAKIATLTVSGGSGVMIGDAVNVARLEALKTRLTVIAPDKPIPWSFKFEEESSLAFVASESMDLNGTRVAVKHYASTDKKKPEDLWITDSGLLTKLSLGGKSSFNLARYKQYRKLIPELQVEKASPN